MHDQIANRMLACCARHLAIAVSVIGLVRCGPSTPPATSGGPSTAAPPTASSAAVSPRASAEKVEVTVPAVAGKPLGEAEKLLADARLSSTVTDERHTTVPRDQVIRQSPSAGERVASGSPVALVVAVNPPPIEGSLKTYSAGFLPGQYTHVALSNAAFLYYDGRTGSGAIGRLVDRSLTQTVDKLFPAAAFPVGATIVDGRDSPRGGQFFYFYNSQTGSASAIAIDAANNLNATMSGTIAPGWTHVVFLMFQGLYAYYNAQTGAAALGGLEAAGPVMQKSYPSGTLPVGLTHLVMVEPHDATQMGLREIRLLGYNAQTGGGLLAGINEQGDLTVMTPFPGGTFPAGPEGWTLVTSAGRAVVHYNGRTRAGAIGKLNLAGTYTIAETFPAHSFSRGWTHAVGLERALYFFNADTRAGAIGEVK